MYNPTITLYTPLYYTFSNIPPHLCYQGDHFGETALLYGTRRAATVRAVCPTTCMALSKYVGRTYGGRRVEEEDEEGGRASGGGRRRKKEEEEGEGEEGGGERRRIGGARGGAVERMHIVRNGRDLLFAARSYSDARTRYTSVAATALLTPLCCCYYLPSGHTPLTCNVPFPHPCRSHVLVPLHTHSSPPLLPTPAHPPFPFPPVPHQIRV